MLGHDPFYHSTLKNLVIAFGHLFDDIEISRKDDEEDEVQRIKVPITYGPKEKFLVRLKENPDLNKRSAITLPRMGFEIGFPAYDAGRKLNTIHKNSILSDSTHKLQQFNPVPYNVPFSLYILAKHTEDANQIVEQILPFFTPNYNLVVNLVPEMDIKIDTPLVLNDTSFEDSWSGSFDNRRVLVWTIHFTFQSYFFGPITEMGIIRKAQTDFHVVPTGDGKVPDPQERSQSPRIFRSVIVPDPIDAANADEAYGYTVSKYWFDDGKKYDPITGTDVSIPFAADPVNVNKGRIQITVLNPTIITE